MKRFKKGFTLVELLAVIVILGIILVIAVPNIMKVIDNAKQNAYENQKRLIINAARNYVSKRNVSILDGEVVEVYLKDLQDANMIDDSVKDPRGGYFDNSKPDGVKVLITKDEDGNISYEIYVPGEEDGGEGDPPGDELLVDKFTPESAGSDGTYELKNGAHRFIGPNPNNWIEFGSIGGTPVMWRIIKKDNEGIQLIYEGLKNGESAPTDNGRIEIDGSWTTVWDTSNSNKWERATLKPLLQDWYNNTLTKNNDLINPINWCIGGSGQGITYPTYYVPIEHYLQTECIDGTYDGGTFKGKTDEVSPVGLIRVSDYISASDHPDCFGSYFEGPGGTEVEYGRRCGRVVNEAERTNYLWKPAYWYWTYTAQATYSSIVWIVYTNGSVRDSSALSYAGSVRPIINLKSDILYDSGEGTLANPYKVQ